MKNINSVIDPALFYLALGAGFYFTFWIFAVYLGYSVYAGKPLLPRHDPKALAKRTARARKAIDAETLQRLGR